TRISLRVLSVTCEPSGKGIAATPPMGVEYSVCSKRRGAASHNPIAMSTATAAAQGINLLRPPPLEGFAALDPKTRPKIGTKRRSWGGGSVPGLAPAPIAFKRLASCHAARKRMYAAQCAVAE